MRIVLTMIPAIFLMLAASGCFFIGTPSALLSGLQTPTPVASPSAVMDTAVYDSTMADLTEQLELLSEKTAELIRLSPGADVSDWREEFTAAEEAFGDTVSKLRRGAENIPAERTADFTAVLSAAEDMAAAVSGFAPAMELAEAGDTAGVQAAADAFKPLYESAMAKLNEAAA